MTRNTARREAMKMNFKTEVRSWREPAHSGLSGLIPHCGTATSGGYALPVRKQSAFTMVEIAISLAIIGIALVAIIGVLPLGMNVQRDNREATVINQDATYFIEAIRGGAQGLNDLTNYVYAIT